MQVINAYNRMLLQRPLLVKACTGLVCGGTGDAIAQRFEGEAASSSSSSPGFNVRRFLTYSLFAAFWTGPVNHAWLPIINGLYPGKTLLSTLKKVIVQQTLWNPFVFMPAFYTAYGIGMGMSVDAVVEKARREYISSLSACVVIWAPATMIIFRFPERYQSVAMALMNVVWNSVLSYETQKGEKARRRRELVSAT